MNYENLRTEIEVFTCLVEIDLQCDMVPDKEKDFVKDLIFSLKEILKKA